MRCPACQADLSALNGAGEPIIRNRGIVLKAHGAVLICPKCKGDVQITPAVAKMIHQRVLFIKR